jgi:hypothetical protein
LFLLYYFLFAQYLYADQTKLQVSMVIGNAMANVGSASTSRHGHRRLDNAIISKTRQRRHQYDSVVTSLHGHHCLGNAITSMTRQ